METPSQPAPVTSRHVARGVGTTLLSRLGGVIEVVAQPLYVLMFGLAGFGLYTVLWAAINLLENIFDLGMTSAMQRTVPQAKDERGAVDSLRAALILGVGPCFLVALAAFVFAPDIAPLINVAARDQPLVIPSIQLFAWALPLWAFVEIATSALRAKQLFGAEIRLRLVWEQVMRLVLAVALYFAGFGLAGLFVAHMISLLITTMLSLRLLTRHYPLRLLLVGQVMSPMFHDTFKSGLSILPANIVQRLFGDAPAIVLNMLLPGSAGASASALYTISRKISSIVQLVRTAFVYVLAPLASSALRHDVGQVRAIYAYATRLISAIVLPLAAVLAAGSISILGLFGREAHMAQGAVIALLVARAGEAMTGASVPVMQVMSGYRQQLWASFAGLGIAALAFALLNGFTPLTGMAMAVGLGIVATTLIPMIQLHIHDHVHPFDGTVLSVIVRAGLFSLAALILALAAAQLPDAFALPLIVVIALAAIWCSARFALPLVDRQSLGKTGRKMRLLPA